MSMHANFVETILVVMNQTYIRISNVCILIALN